MPSHYLQLYLSYLLHSSLFLPPFSNDSPCLSHLSLDYTCLNRPLPTTWSMMRFCSHKIEYKKWHVLVCSTRPPNCAVHSKWGSRRRILILSLTAPRWIRTVPFVSYCPCYGSKNWTKGINIIKYCFLKILRQKHMTYHLVNSFHRAVCSWIFNRREFWFYWPILEQGNKVFFKFWPIVKDHFAWA